MKAVVAWENEQAELWRQVAVASEDAWLLGNFVHLQG